jgi:pectin methylesterase-like acyl-CoA thioesterase
VANRITKLIFGTGLAIIALLAALTMLAGPAIAADQCVIPGGGGGCLATIQAAINAAGSGETVRVVAGTYPERVVIAKNLTLLDTIRERDNSQVAFGKL